MLSQITIQNFRNIQEQSVFPASGINLLIGENGSGKSSFLEAIYLISMGRSFRSRTLKTLIQYDQSAFTIFVRTSDKTPIGFQFHVSSGTHIKLNNAPLKRLSELASYLPIQFIPADCHEFFYSGPKFRRQFLDFGVFHVKHEFNLHWQTYKKALVQRNAAIKEKSANGLITLWNKQLVEHGDKITKYRLSYLKQLFELFIAKFKVFCLEFCQADYKLAFNQGWTKDKTLEDVLDENIERDKICGYTKSGIHSADWTIKINNLDAKEHLSRGQQKLYFIALSLAQIELIQQIKSNTPIVLIDDIGAELDRKKQDDVISGLRELDAQVFITSTDEKIRATMVEKDKVFHVKQGVIVEDDK